MRHAESAMESERRQQWIDILLIGYHPTGARSDNTDDIVAL
jgi:hypothetical protein